jgi:hypothetical protein
MAKKPKLTHGTFPLLLVEWKDACVDLGWSSNHASQSASITSVGWKIHEDDKTFVLGSDIGDDVDETTKVVTTETNRRIAIPKDWVTNVRELK